MPTLWWLGVSLVGLAGALRAWVQWWPSCVDCRNLAGRFSDGAFRCGKCARHRQRIAGRVVRPASYRRGC